LELRAGVQAAVTGDIHGRLSQQDLRSKMNLNVYIQTTFLPFYELMNAYIIHLILHERKRSDERSTV
jgi:hypothetical protein